MITHLHKTHQKTPTKILSFFITLSFLMSSVVGPNMAYAQGVSTPAGLVMSTPAFMPVMVKAIEIDPKNPLHFGFVVDSGDTGLDGDALTEESKKLIRYFLASLTTPEKDMWVNLSPYEKDRIIADSFGATQMGRDLLEQDYMLKQLTASLIYPEDELGKKFWKKIYKRAYDEFGTTDVPMNTFNKVWIVPKTATVYEHGNRVFVIDSELEVMMEEDYNALMNNLGRKDIGMQGKTDTEAKTASTISADIVREIVIPEIEKEVNFGKNFANLRQVYNAMILATWYKNNLKASLLGQVYVDQSKTKGIEIDDKQANEKIYAQYLQAFKDGVYDYIKVEQDEFTGKNMPRKYFSGGFSRTSSGVEIKDMVVTIPLVPVQKRGKLRQKGKTRLIDIGLVENGTKELKFPELAVAASAVAEKAKEEIKNILKMEMGHEAQDSDIKITKDSPEEIILDITGVAQNRLTYIIKTMDLSGELHKKFPGFDVDIPAVLQQEGSLTQRLIFSPSSIVGRLALLGSLKNKDFKINDFRPSRIERKTLGLSLWKNSGGEMESIPAGIISGGPKGRGDTNGLSKEVILNNEKFWGLHDIFEKYVENFNIRNKDQLIAIFYNRANGEILEVGIGFKNRADNTKENLESLKVEIGKWIDQELASVSSNIRYVNNPATIPASERKEIVWPSVLKDPDNAVNVAISGIGAIGKLLVRQWRLYNNPNMNVVAIIGKPADPKKSPEENLKNQLINAQDIVEKTKFSSAHGRFDVAELVAGMDNKGVFIKVDPGTAREKRISIVDRENDAAKYPWGEMNVDILLEASGQATEISKARKHIEAGAKHVLIAAPGKGVDGTYVVGVNEEKFDPTDPNQEVVSNASCTTNAIAPAMRVIEKIGFVAGSLNSTHAVTNNQRLLDWSFLKKPEQGWGALRNIILTSTGASKALMQLGRNLWARMSGSAYRVSTGTGSVITLDWKLTDPNTSVEDIIKAFEDAQDGDLKGILKIDNSLSTRDIVDTTEGAIVSKQSIKIVRDGDSAMAHVQIWYDNENGYTTQLMKMIDEMAKKMEMKKNREKIIVKKDAPVVLAPVASAEDIADPEIPDNILEARKPIKTLKRPVKVGLFGPGRVGRLFIRDLVGNPNIDLVSIPYSKPSDLARMISIDTVHRRLDADLEFSDEERWISINGKKIYVPYRDVEQPSIDEILDDLGVDKTRKDISVDSKKGILRVGEKEIRIWSKRPTEPADIDWSADGAEIVIDATGKYVEPGALAGHLGGTVKKVILAAPAKSLKEPGAPEIDGSFVYGVNEKDFDAKKQHNISNASCTTNALAPVVKVINDIFGVKIGMMSTTHSETVSQPNLDSHEKTPDREPGGPDNIVLTTTGAAKALGLVIKELKGKLDGDALRVPSPDGSVINLTIETQKPVKDAATLNKVLKMASEGYMKGLLSLEKMETSKQVVGRLEASVVAEQGTSVMQLPNGGSLIKLHIFYDNERGYNAQLIRLTEYVGQESLAAEVLPEVATISSTVKTQDVINEIEGIINHIKQQNLTLKWIEMKYNAKGEESHFFLADNLGAFIEKVKADNAWDNFDVMYKGGVTIKAYGGDFKDRTVNLSFKDGQIVFDGDPSIIPIASASSDVAVNFPAGTFDIGKFIVEIQKERGINIWEFKIDEKSYFNTKITEFKKVFLEEGQILFLDFWSPGSGDMIHNSKGLFVKQENSQVVIKALKPIGISGNYETDQLLLNEAVLVVQQMVSASSGVTINFPTGTLEITKLIQTIEEGIREGLDAYTLNGENYSANRRTSPSKVSLQDGDSLTLNFLVLGQGAKGLQSKKSVTIIQKDSQAEISATDDNGNDDPSLAQMVVTAINKWMKKRESIMASVNGKIIVDQSTGILPTDILAQKNSKETRIKINGTYFTMKINYDSDSDKTTFSLYDSSDSNISKLTYVESGFHLDDRAKRIIVKKTVKRILVDNNFAKSEEEIDPEQSFVVLQDGYEFSNLIATIAKKLDVSFDSQEDFPLWEKTIFSDLVDIVVNRMDSFYIAKMIKEILIEQGFAKSEEEIDPEQSFVLLQDEYEFSSLIATIAKKLDVSFDSQEDFPLWEKTIFSDFVDIVVNKINNRNSDIEIILIENLKLASSTSEKVTHGGINLDSGLLDLQIKRDGNGIPLPVAEQPLDMMKIEGFSFFIMSVTPVSSMFLLSGLPEPKEDDTSLTRASGLDIVEPKARFEAKEVEELSKL